MRISRTVMAVCGAVLAAALIGFTNPKAVHAVTAALVQVTNTASNPAVTQSVGAQAGNMVHLFCDVPMDEFVTQNKCELYPANANGQTVFGYTVPDGQSLVITAADLQPLGSPLCSGDYYAQLTAFPSYPLVFLEATTPNSILTTHFSYPSVS